MSFKSITEKLLLGSVGAALLAFVLPNIWTANQPPVVKLTSSPASGAAPLDVSFTAAGSYDPEGDRLTYQWKIDEREVSTQSVLRHVFDEPGERYVVQVTVTDAKGVSRSASLVVTTAQVLKPGKGGQEEEGAGTDTKPSADKRRGLDSSGAPQQGGKVELSFQSVEVINDGTSGGTDWSFRLFVDDVPQVSSSVYLLDQRKKQPQVIGGTGTVGVTDESPPKLRVDAYRPKGKYAGLSLTGEGRELRTDMTAGEEEHLSFEITGSGKPDAHFVVNVTARRL